MKLEGDEKLIDVKICKDDEDALLATRLGRAIRFQVDDIRVFSGRTSTGVRGIKLSKGDEVISMSILKHVEATPDERTAYLKKASALRGADTEGMEVEAENGNITISEERFKDLQAREQFLLTVTSGGFGKRTSAYEYRLSGRGGQGVTNIGLTKKNGALVAGTFPVTEEHQIMLVTNGGQMIRMPVGGIRFTGRSAQGVTLFRVGEGEQVVSVAWLKQEAEEEVENDPDVMAMEPEQVIENPETSSDDQT